MIRSVNLGCDSDSLSHTQKQGIISILPKGDKPREFLKNWRPISLLNNSYKIISSCIANRLKTVLDFLIHENQKGFLKGRYIGDNTRLIYDILFSAKENQIPGMILQIDFEKAFDSVSWKFMYKALKFFNFGSDLIRWVKCLYNGASLCVLQNGFFSDFFNIGRGCRQGDPVSPYIYIICAEIMGILIRQNKNIKGLKIGLKTFCLLQFADDTTLFLDGSNKSLKNALDLLFQFSKYSGLKPNIDKTKAIWIGSKAHSDDTICNDINVSWSKEPFNILGIIFTADLRHMEDLNYKDKLQKIKKDINIWSKRNLTPLGKITVVKSILLPKLTHLFTSLPRPKSDIVDLLQNMLYKFIWSNKRDRISRKTMIQDYKAGGCRMTDIDSFIKSLKLTWIRRINNSECDWLYLFSLMTKCDVRKIPQFGSDFLKQCKSNCTNEFWKEMINALIDFRSKLPIQSMEDILKSPLWFNSDITIDHKPVYFHEMYQKGFYYVRDLFTDNGDFISFNVLNIDHNIKLPFTRFLGLKSAILSKWPSLKDIITIHHDISQPFVPKYLSIIFSNKKGCKSIYDIFIANLNDRGKFKSCVKWESELHLQEGFNWEKINVIPFKTTLDTKLRWFQIRLNFRILATNKFLFMINIVNSPLCSICKSSEENLLHLFVYCSKVKEIWNGLENWLRIKIDSNLHLSDSTIILGLNSNSKYSVSINLLILLTKYFIYSYSRKGIVLFMESLKGFLRYYYMIEKIIYSNRNDLLDSRWKLLKDLFL